MATPSLPSGALILVADGRRALTLRNEGDEAFPNLVAVEILEDAANPRAADQGADRPGRAIEKLTGRRSAFEIADRHDERERAFAIRTAAAFEAIAARSPSAALIVIAPARALARLRAAFSPAIEDRRPTEIDKDLTRHPIGRIEAILLGRDSPQG